MSWLEICCDDCDYLFNMQCMVHGDDIINPQALQNCSSFKRKKDCMVCKNKIDGIKSPKCSVDNCYISSENRFQKCSKYEFRKDCGMETGLARIEDDFQRKTDGDAKELHRLKVQVSMYEDENRFLRDLLTKIVMNQKQ